jgi:hypothetical protein
MEYTTKEINRNYLIKVSGIGANGERINTLVGVSGTYTAYRNGVSGKIRKASLRRDGRQMRMQASQRYQGFILCTLKQDRL